jgi:hypothetical protein
MHQQALSPHPLSPFNSRYPCTSLPPTFRPCTPNRGTSAFFLTRLPSTVYSAPSPMAPLSLHRPRNLIHSSCHSPVSTPPLSPYPFSLHLHAHEHRSLRHRFVPLTSTSGYSPSPSYLTPKPFYRPLVAAPLSYHLLHNPL